MLAVLITGPPGAGKTSVLTALVDALSGDDVAHAAVEIEMLIWTHPATTDDQRREHVRTQCALHRQAGHRLLLVAETIETDEDLADLQGALAAEEYFLVRLEAQAATLVRRLLGRESESWSGLPALIQHTRELAVSMPALHGVDLILSTEGQAAEDVAARIRAALPNRLLAPQKQR